MFSGPERFRPGTPITILVWLGLAACLYSIATDYHYQWDLYVYHTAARLLVQGKALYYVPIYPFPWDRANIFFYNYPPMTLYLFLWLVPLSVAAAKLIWVGLRLVALAFLVRLWHKSFERLNFGWPVVLFLSLGFNSTLLRDFAAGNISTFEQLGLWLGFSLLIRGHLYAAALILACVSQFKFLPVVFLGLIPLVRPREGWKPFAVGCVAFLGLLALNVLINPDLAHDYVTHFADPRMRLDDRGVVNPSSLAMFRDFLDVTAYTNGLPSNVAAGTRIYVLYLIALALVLIRVAWSRRAKFYTADPKLLVYFACALFMMVAPRLKDYSYILILIPALFVVRNLDRQGVRANYVLLAVGAMACGQPQEIAVPGMRSLVLMVQAYLPLFLTAAIMVYTLRMILLAEDAPARAQDRTPYPAPRAYPQPRASW